MGGFLARALGQRLALLAVISVVAHAVILLAPGCASFDQYRSFEERGEDFRRSVARLAAGGDTRA